METKTNLGIILILSLFIFLTGCITDKDYETQITYKPEGPYEVDYNDIVIEFEPIGIINVEFRCYDEYEYEYVGSFNSTFVQYDGSIYLVETKGINRYHIKNLPFFNFNDDILHKNIKTFNYSGRYSDKLNCVGDLLNYDTNIHYKVYDEGFEEEYNLWLGIRFMISCDDDVDCFYSYEEFPNTISLGKGFDPYEFYDLIKSEILYEIFKDLEIW